MRRGETLLGAIRTLSTPEEITDFYEGLVKIYIRTPHLFKSLEQVGHAAHADLAYGLSRTPMPVDKRTMWLETLPPEVSENFHEGQFKFEPAIYKTHQINQFDRVMGDVRYVKHTLERARHKLGLMLLGVRPNRQS